MAERFRFMFDECVSPQLVMVANELGHDGVHVTHRGLNKTPDPKIARYCVEHDHVLVTNNAQDYRRIYSSLSLHPGLIVILPNVGLPLQQAFFTLAVRALEDEGDAINKLAEVEEGGHVTICDWPSPA